MLVDSPQQNQNNPIPNSQLALIEKSRNAKMSKYSDLLPTCMPRRDKPLAGSCLPNMAESAQNGEMRSYTGSQLLTWQA